MFEDNDLYIPPRPAPRRPSVDEVNQSEVMLGAALRLAVLTVLGAVLLVWLL
jgi:hypothetical protein